MTNLEKAKRALATGGYTCALYRDERVHTSLERGVKPLVSWLESGIDFQGFSAADKVVGKGAAFLYLLLGVEAVYAGIISAPALALLQNRGVFVEYDTLTEHIINRNKDGLCPFEAAVLEIDDPKTAYLAIRAKMKELNITIGTYKN